MDPSDPTPGAPATDPTPTPAAPAPGPAPADPAAPFDPAALSPEAKAYLQDQINKADLKARTTSKANAAQEAREALLAEFAQKLGLDGDQTPDPDALVEHAQAVAFRSSVQLGVYRAAGRLGADADALLDSNSLIDSLDDLIDNDPQSPDFIAAVEAKVQEALEKYPGKYKTAGQESAPAPRPDPSQGSRGGQPTPFAGQSLGAAIASHYAGKQ